MKEVGLRERVRADGFLCEMCCVVFQESGLSLFFFVCKIFCLCEPFNLNKSFPNHKKRRKKFIHCILLRTSDDISVVFLCLSQGFCDILICSISCISLCQVDGLVWMCGGKTSFTQWKTCSKHPKQMLSSVSHDKIF